MNSTAPQPKISFDELLGLLLPQPLPQFLLPCVSLSSGSSCGKGDTLLSLHCAERGWQGSARQLDVRCLPTSLASSLPPAVLAGLFHYPGSPVHSGKWSTDCTSGAEHAGPELFICEHTETSPIPKWCGTALGRNAKGDAKAARVGTRSCMVRVSHVHITSAGTLPAQVVYVLRCGF